MFETGVLNYAKGLRISGGSCCSCVVEESLSDFASLSSSGKVFQSLGAAQVTRVLINEPRSQDTFIIFVLC